MKRCIGKFAAMFVIALSVEAQAAGEQQESAATDTERPAEQKSAVDGDDTDDPDFVDAPETDAPPVTVNADGTIPAWRSAASPEQQARAREFFREGNALVQESLFVQAVSKYEEALKEWDHPGIHYNLALALLNLDQPLRFREHLVDSLKFGPEALGKDKARRVEQYLTLVEKQLTELHVVALQQGARVELDGALLFTGPGEFKEFVRPGAHTLKVSAPGFETSQKSHNLIPGQPLDLSVTLYRPEEWLVRERRWNPLGPILVTVSGVVVLGAGGALYGVGASKVNAFDKKVEEQCGKTGCSSGAVKDTSASGVTLQGVGIGTMAVGATAVAVGGVLLYMNRSVTRRVDPEEQKLLSVLPYAGPGQFGLVGSGSF